MAISLGCIGGTPNFSNAALKAPEGGGDAGASLRWFMGGGGNDGGPAGGLHAARSKRL